MEFRTKALLNGWWDFQPADHANPGACDPHRLLVEPLFPLHVPVDGWSRGAYLVPGFFTDHCYPAEWRQGRSGWMKTRFATSPPSAGWRAYLTLRAAIPMAQVFVNGVRLYVQDDMFIGDAVDVTDQLVAGTNELAVFLTEHKTFPHPTSGSLSLVDVPWGCCIAEQQAGLWQDVELEWRPEVHISDVTIATSTRLAQLTITAVARNCGSTPFEGHVAFGVQKPEGPSSDPASPTSALPEFSPQPVHVAPGAEAQVCTTVPWAGYRAWCPSDPYLYQLTAELAAHGGARTDSRRIRFGFREVWVEGHRVFVNGRPQRWAGEWCHKAHSHWLRPEYVRQWFQQLKDLNCTYARMHTFPHPEYFLDIADEMGIMVCQESALHGSGQSGWETPDLWPRFEAHLARMVRRDKNHPSLVIWSVENEMRWSLNIVPGAKERLPGYRLLMNRLDPTRPAYHDGDTSLWNEDQQSIISRHYGAACHGMGWWDKRVPLHAGEVGRWHYASPYTAMQWAGDEVFTDYALLAKSIAKDCARILELGRANEVSCMFLWNTSGLDNLRPARARSFEWPDPSAPGLKPLAHKAYESEYAWWEAGSGYRPGWSFDTLKRALRPLALVVREERNQFYSDAVAPHTVWVVNDTDCEAAGQLRVALSLGGRELWSHEVSISVRPGLTQEAAFAVPCALPQAAWDDATTDGPLAAAIVTSFVPTRPGAATDEVRREVRVSRHAATCAQALPGPGALAMVGHSKLARWFSGHGLHPVVAEWGALPSPAQVPLLVVAENSVSPGSTQNAELRRYVSEGGRVLILEQSVSPFPGLQLSRMPVETAFMRDPEHPALSGVTNDDLRFWGDDPFGLPSSQSWVVTSPYLKPTGGTVVRSLIDSSGGDFATGGLQWAPMVEVRVGQGTVLATQLRMADRWNALPIADTLLRSALSYLVGYQASSQAGADIPRALREATDGWPLDASATSPARVIVVDGAGSGRPGPEVRALAEAGGTVVAFGVTPATTEYWSQVLHTRVEAWAPEAAVHHLIGSCANPLLAGLSNEDTCYMDNWTYKSSGSSEQMVDFLLTVVGGSNALTNSDRSGLDTLFAEGNATEWRRTAALSAYFDGPRPRVGGALVEIPIGTGRVVLCQVIARPDMWQFRRFVGQLGANLGLAVWADVLAGECVAAKGRASDGFPVRIRALARPTEADVAEAASLCKRRMESYAGNDPFRQWPGWSELPCPGGIVTQASVPGSDGSVASLLMGIEVVCPEPRKFMQTIGGLPSPDLQTFLRLFGEGDVVAWINGREWGRCSLQAGAPAGACIADIDFDEGSNFVVLLWHPSEATQATSLAMRFERNDRSPETTFTFA